MLQKQPVLRGDPGSLKKATPTSLGTLACGQEGSPTLVSSSFHPKVAIKCRNPPLMPAGLREGTRLSWSEPTNEGDDDSGGPAHLSPPLWLTTQNVFYCQMSVFTCVCVCVWERASVWVRLYGCDAFNYNISKPQDGFREL